MNAPILTVVVLSRDRPLRLRWLRQALGRPGDVEVLESRCFASVGAAVRAGRARRVALLDEDLLPGPGWADRAAAGAELVQGSVAVDPQQIVVLDNAPHLVAARVVPPRVWAPAINVAGARDTLVSLAVGLDARTPCAVLHARARAAGVPVIADPQLIAWSSPQRAPTRPGAAAAVRRHPELRRDLHLGVFTRRAHLRLLLAAAGWLLGPRGALLVLPWALQREPGDGAGAKGTIKAALRLPTRTARDARSLASAITEAARERTLVL